MLHLNLEFSANQSWQGDRLRNNETVGWSICQSQSISSANHQSQVVFAGNHMTFNARLSTMFARILLLFTLIPFVELVVLLQVHHAVSAMFGAGMGLLVTLGTIVVTGVVGAALARQQGIGVLRQVQSEMAQGQVPGRALADGILVLLGAAFLLTPGFLTDIAGFSLLFPVSRAFYRRKVVEWFQHNVRVQKAGGADVFVVDSVPKEVEEHSRH